MVRKPPACLSEECRLFAQNESSRPICNRLIGVYTGIGSPESAEAAPLKPMIHSILQLCLLPTCVCYRLSSGQHTFFPSSIISKTTHCHPTPHTSSLFIYMPLFPKWSLPVYSSQTVTRTYAPSSVALHLGQFL